MRRRATTTILWLALGATVVAQSATLSAQTSIDAALAIVAQLDAEAARIKQGTTRQTIRDLLANLRLVLESDPGCPVCPTCPEPPVCPEPEPCPTCPPDPPPAEECGNGVDDDGDGQVDEDCVPPLPPGPNVSTAAELLAALADPTISEIRLAQGRYDVNLVITRPVVIVGAQGLAGRVALTDVALWQLVAKDPLQAVVKVTGPVTDVTVRGVTITGVAKDRTAVIVGSNMATDVSQQPSRITIDQTAVLAVNALGHRGIEAHGAHVAITRNHIAGWLENGRDSQGVYGTNGPGPYLIEDNYIEASGQNILFGGDTVRIPNLVPADITIRRNRLYKAPEWTAISDVKNSFELKCAKRVIFEDNVIDGNWRDAQEGSTILLTARNQYGASPWCLVDEVTIRRNVLRNTPHAFAVNILGHDDNFQSGQTRTVTITGNLFEDSPNGIRIGRGVVNRLTVTNNTAPRVTGRFLYYVGLDANGVPLGGFTPTTADRNVFTSGAYGVFGEGPVQPGTSTIVFWSNGNYSLTGNLIEKSAARTIPYPAGNTQVAPGTLLSLLDPVTYAYPPDPTVGYLGTGQ